MEVTSSFMSADVEFKVYAKPFIEFVKDFQSKEPSSMETDQPLHKFEIFNEPSQVCVS